MEKQPNKFVLLGIGIILLLGLFIFSSSNPITTPDQALAQEPAGNAESENCITCHTNQSMIQSLAKDEEITSEATEGEG